MITYIFKVELADTPQIWRTIEIKEDQTFEELHHVIQAAFGFDDDHLYSFFLSGKAWDKKTEITLNVAEFNSETAVKIKELSGDDPPDVDAVLQLIIKEVYGVDSSEVNLDVMKRQDPMAHKMLMSMVEEVINPPKDVSTTTIGSVGLRTNKKILYLFDYGDEWHFNVRVKKINKNPDAKAKYPRILEIQGEAPAQYAYDDDDDWDEFDEVPTIPPKQAVEMGLLTKREALEQLIEELGMPATLKPNNATARRIAKLIYEHASTEVTLHDVVYDKFLADRCTFPFDATIIRESSLAPFKLNETVTIEAMVDKDDFCLAHPLMLAKFHDARVAIRLDQINPSGAPKATATAVNDVIYLLDLRAIED